MPGPSRKAAAWLPILVILVAMTSIQSGASLAKSLFPVVGAPGVTALRLALGQAPSPPDTAYVEKLGHESVKQSLANLRTFPCIKTKEAKGNLTLHGAFFAIHDGVLHLLDEAEDEFSPVD